LVGVGGCECARDGRVEEVRADVLHESAGGVGSRGLVHGAGAELKFEASIVFKRQRDRVGQGRDVGGVGGLKDGEVWDDIVNGDDVRIVGALSEIYFVVCQTDDAAVCSVGNMVIAPDDLFAVIEIQRDLEVLE
jgi:hypothetical protein